MILIVLCRVVPRNIHAAAKAKKLEEEKRELYAQLQEHRIAIMISQIQPHFIYNTLGTIQQLCKVDPEQAAQLVHNFSLYLQRNFGELNGAKLIRFTQEMEHVHHYTNIEQVRFPDITVTYDIQLEDCMIPALTIQPMVENAIKHGLMGLEEGGTVVISAYETETHYCVSIADDGIGFVVEDLSDSKGHIGIRNVRERLKALCDGSLTLESCPGKGTRALIQIPKEGKEE